MKILILLAVISSVSVSAMEGRNFAKPSTPPDVEIIVSKKDISIIQRALEILSSAEKWNRRDNRQCPKKAKTFSLYCALYEASLEISGEFDHRRAALEEVRRSVEEASRGKTYEHRLMDFNNDVSTSFESIRSVLKKTESRLRARL